MKLILGALAILVGWYLLLLAAVALVAAANFIVGTVRGRWRVAAWQSLMLLYARATMAPWKMGGFALRTRLSEITGGAATEVDAAEDLAAEDDSVAVPAQFGGFAGELLVEADRVVFVRDGREQRSFPARSIAYFRTFPWTTGKITGFYVVAVSIRESTLGVVELGLVGGARAYFFVHPTDLDSLSLDLQATAIKHRGGGRLPRSARPGRG